MNNELYDIKDVEEKVILIAADTGTLGENVEESVDELEELAKTAQAITVGKVIQNLERINSAHYLGKGKLQEIKELISEKEATGIICDDELSPAQIKNMEEILNTKIMDRTMLILDIFANRAWSKEGKIQVELAQLQYRLSRLVGLGKSLSRLGAGIGTRGPGEKKLETDRRHIRSRISQLRNELKHIEEHRELIRTRRKKSNIPQIAIVGYTNAGKSTLLNILSDANIYAEDQLFATLDPTSRKVELPGGTEVLFTDTVGFIRKLPHNLIKAFKSTLEEVKYADIILHVIDASSDTRENNIKVVYDTIKQLGVTDQPIITVYNKMDLEVERPLPGDENASKILSISAVKKLGIEQILKSVEEVIQQGKKKIKVIIPYGKEQLLNNIYGNSEILTKEYVEQGTSIELYAEEYVYNKLKDYMV